MRLVHFPAPNLIDRRKNKQVEEFPDICQSSCFILLVCYRCNISVSVLNKVADIVEFGAFLAFRMCFRLLQCIANYCCLISPTPVCILIHHASSFIFGTCFIKPKFRPGFYGDVVHHLKEIFIFVYLKTENLLSFTEKDTFVILLQFSKMKSQLDPIFQSLLKGST